MDSRLIPYDLNRRRIMRVLILCTGNSTRSQMAEGLLRQDGGAEYEVFSRPARNTEVGIEGAPDIGIRRACRCIDCGDSFIADGG